MKMFLLIKKIIKKKKIVFKFIEFLKKENNFKMKKFVLRLVTDLSENFIIINNILGIKKNPDI